MIILGTIEHLCTRWRMMRGPSNLIEQGDRIVSSILHGIIEKKRTNRVSLHLEPGDETENTAAPTDACDRKKEEQSTRPINEK